jgi:hypothetical protein
MTDPLADAFARVQIPEPGADFDRRVVARLAPLAETRLRSARRVMACYWVAAASASAISIAPLGASSSDMLLGYAALAAVMVCSIVAGGGPVRVWRALRHTCSAA